MKYQLAVIGGGPAGYTAAEAAAKAGLAVILFEKSSLGGVCLNEGCIPTKTLLYSAKVHDTARHAAKYAVKAESVSADLPKIISRKTKVVRKLVLGIKARLSACGVTVVTGEAFIIDRHTVRCGEETYDCNAMLVCTGSRTAIPPIPGLDEVPYWTHREALECKELPISLTIVGGGVIGMEFASFFNSLGTEVTVIEMTDEILGGADREIASALRAEYAKKGVKFLLGTTVKTFRQTDGKICTFFENASGEKEVRAERLLVCVGRRPANTGFGLENLHLAMTERGTVRVDEHLQTSVPGVYVCGDLNGISLLAHTAVREAEIAVHHLTGIADHMDYSVIPGVVYTNPEVAWAGRTEESLQAEGIPYRAVKLPLAYSGRFVAENEGTNGLIKVLVSADDTVLGVHILGNPASELIVLGGMMVQDQGKLADYKRYVFPHPTVGEIFKEL